MDDDEGLEQRESLEKEGIRLRSRSRGPPPPMELEHPGHSSSDDEWKLDGGTLTTVELEGCAVLRPPKIGKTSSDSCLCCSMSGGSLKNFMDRAWRTLHDAAEIRRDSVFFFLKEQGTRGERRALRTARCLPQGMLHSLYKQTEPCQYQAEESSHPIPTIISHKWLELYAGN